METINVLRTVLAVALVACSNNTAHSPNAAPPSPPPVATPSPPADAPLAETLTALFGATQGPDPAEVIAKLEAQRATMPEAERKLVDRMIAIARANAAAAAEPDPTKQRPLHLRMARETLTLADELGALGADDLDLQLKVAGSLVLLARQIESLDLAGEIRPRTVKQKALAIAERMINVHPRDAKAWLLHAGLTPYDEPETRLRSFAKCVEIDPSSAICKEVLDQELAEYVLPFCEGADIKADFTWRAASKSPTPGSRKIEVHYETFHLAAVPRFTVADVVRIQAERTRIDTHGSDGKVTTEWHDGIRLELAPGKRDEMIAWSRELEQRGERRVILRGTRVVGLDSRAMFDDDTPGVVGIRIDEVCAKTKTRTPPVSAP